MAYTPGGPFVDPLKKIDEKLDQILFERQKLSSVAADTMLAILKQNYSAILELLERNANLLQRLEELLSDKRC